MPLSSKNEMVSAAWGMGIGEVRLEAVVIVRVVPLEKRDHLVLDAVLPVDFACHRQVPGAEEWFGDALLREADPDEQLGRKLLLVLAPH